MSEPIEFTGATKLPLPVERVLTNPVALTLTEAVVLGWAPDGSLHFAASDPDMARALMLVTVAQRRIMEQISIDAVKGS